MRWQYHIIFREGSTATCTSEERIWEPLHYFRRKFGLERVVGAKERFGEGKWTDSTLLPTSPEEIIP